MSRETAPVVLSILVGLPRTIGDGDAADPGDRPWVSGTFKEPVAGPVAVGRTNLAGDGQADLVHHGGPDKAICAYSADHYDDWRRELGLPSFGPGASGENFSIAGLDEAAVCVGDVWGVGDVTVEVSQPRQPCWKLARRWGVIDLAERALATGRTRWYFRVRAEGTVAPGRPMTLIERPWPDWTIARVNRVRHHDKANLALAAVPALSASWRAALAKRLERALA